MGGQAGDDWISFTYDDKDALSVGGKNIFQGVIHPTTGEINTTAAEVWWDNKG